MQVKILNIKEYMSINHNPKCDGAKKRYNTFLIILVCTAGESKSDSPSRRTSLAHISSFPLHNSHFSLFSSHNVIWSSKFPAFCTLNSLLCPLDASSAKQARTLYLAKSWETLYSQTNLHCRVKHNQKQNNYKTIIKENRSKFQYAKFHG